MPYNGYEDTPTANAVTDYNSAALQNSRLHELWLRCHERRLHGHLIQYNDLLDSIWSELAREYGLALTSPEFKTYFKFQAQITKNLKNRRKLNQLLLLKEIWLGNLQNKQGKGTKYIDPHADDFE